MSDDTEDISLNFGEENATSGRKNIRWVIKIILATVPSRRHRNFESKSAVKFLSMVTVHGTVRFMVRVTCRFRVRIRVSV